MINQETINQYIKDGHLAVSIIADSVSEAGKRLTTFQLKYPRFIHAEVMTHRVFSRNASSSRAIPTQKMIEQVRTNPAMPIHWGVNQSGMQAEKELKLGLIRFVKHDWDVAARQVARLAENLVEWGLHKQVTNRILEPFQHIHVVLTATEFDNFFELRAHKDAQPEIYALAVTMQQTLNKSKPKLLKSGQWHLPYVLPHEYVAFDNATLLKISTARCCRVSYLNHDQSEPSVEADLALYERLVGSSPLHASPAEHQATPMNEESKHMTSNLQGWLQHRKMIEK